MQCPLCHFEQAEGRIDCESCGLVFAKWKNKQASKSAPPPAPEPVGDVDGVPTGDERKPSSMTDIRLYQRLGKLYFQTDDKEGLAYFPWGAVWKGFKVEDPERLAKIERFETIFSCIHCPLVSILGLINLMLLIYFPSQAAGWFLFLFVYLAASYLFFGFLSTHFTWDLPFSKAKFNQKKYLIGFFKSFKIKGLIDLEVLSLLLVLSGVYLLITGNFTLFFMNDAPLVWKTWLSISAGLLVLSTVYFYLLDGKLNLDKLLGGK
jgi:hypothetical protein